jgi:TonB family protein
MVTIRNRMDGGGGALILLFVLLSFVVHALFLWTLSRLNGLFFLARADRPERAVEVEVVPPQKPMVRRLEPPPQSRPIDDEAKVIKLPDDAPGRNARPEKTRLYAQTSRRVDVEELPEPSPIAEPAGEAPAKAESAADEAAESAPTGTKLKPYAAHEGERMNTDDDWTTVAKKEARPEPLPKPAPSRPDLLPDRKKLIAISRKHDLSEGQSVVSPSIKTGKAMKLNTTEFDYVPYSVRSAVRLGDGELKDDQYSLHILNRVRHELYYPPASVQNHEQGTVVVRFYILKDGSVDPDAVSLFKSSGYPMLDDALVTSIRLSSRFNPIPERLKTDSVPVEFTVEYILR